MEQVIEVARRLREEHDFRGYIHLKTIPDASDALLEKAGRYADRLSINVELPSEESLKKLAPEKKVDGIRISMARLRSHIDIAKEEPKATAFAATGQSTQLIVGADASSDKKILDLSENLYGSYRLKRVYYSAFSPIPDASAALPLSAPPLIREHRLYQADWLMRFYGFRADEIVSDETSMLNLDIDPKLAWALKNRELFPVDLNRAPKESLMRVPGLGLRNVNRILSSRRFRSIRCVDLAALRINIPKILPFVILADHRPSSQVTDDLRLEKRLRPHSESQLDLFAAPLVA
jgi:putative DNA modification/repair radical SAM protein